MGRRTANAQACLLEWGLVGDGAGRGGTGRDSRLGARSVGAVGGAAGTSWSKCWGLRRPPIPYHFQRLQRQVRTVLGRGRPGPRLLELRPRYNQGPGGQGRLDAVRRARGPGKAALGLGIWWAAEAGLPAEPPAQPPSHLLIIEPRGSFGEGLLSSLRRTFCCLPTVSSESKAAVQPPSLIGTAEGRLGGMGPGSAWACPWLLCREPSGCW